MKIAIDGPAGSGKTSLARALAEHFGCRYVETGKLYRAVALGFERGIALEQIELDLTRQGRILLNGEDVSDLLHTPQIDQGSSQVAADPAVREFLGELADWERGHYEILLREDEALRDDYWNANRFSPLL